VEFSHFLSNAEGKKEITKREQRKYDKEGIKEEMKPISFQRKEKYLKNSNSELKLVSLLPTCQRKIQRKKNHGQNVKLF
jgi:hypothetical protein